MLCRFALFVAVLQCYIDRFQYLICFGVALVLYFRMQRVATRDAEDLQVATRCAGAGSPRRATCGV